jgi:hypothetical protein
VLCRKVLVEGSPETADLLFAQRTRDAICVHAVLCGRARDVAFVEAASSHPAMRGIQELMTPQFIKDLQPGLHMHGPVEGRVQV